MVIVKKERANCSLAFGRSKELRIDVAGKRGIPAVIESLAAPGVVGVDVPFGQGRKDTSRFGDRERLAKALEFLCQVRVAILFPIQSHIRLVRGP